ncbi:hypothetical protein AFK24_20215 [Pseudomonas syringae]|uniref:Sel1 repeat family protein n=1 Tax=Pseudomonas syringae TaxID=317 RepID=A0A1C7Z369_PSESX|nr:sel1 repeat family protein [Pseudomonas syringae]OCR23427.1 hypothetical protein AFK24_20215 [Pseudomonas syringae]
MKLICVLLAVFWAGGTMAGLTAEQQEAKIKGMYLYNLIRHDEAQASLKLAADAGDVDAQYYLAEIIRQGKMMMTVEASKLYESAAKQGSVDAMIRLANVKNDLCVITGSCPLTAHAPNEWAHEARKIAEAKAKDGDNEAMRQLFSLTGELKFLFQAAEAGNGEAQYRLAGLYREGFGFFILPNNRAKEVEKWLLRSAESGNPHAMNSYANLLLRRDDKKKAGIWIEKAAQVGHVGAMSSYIAYTAHMPNAVDYPLDYVKAYGLALLFSSARFDTSDLSFSAKILAKIAPEMSQKQLDDAKFFSEQWAKIYPALSEFRPKYTY